MTFFLGNRVITSPNKRWWGLQHEGDRLSLFLVLKVKAR